ncbi:hypothetical protein [Aeromonas hydrophila]|uniref:hypothetical protein n=1 Tax=Aeromonas hydrophila TaxID=644 RepID=UPI003D1F1067
MKVSILTLVSLTRNDVLRRVVKAALGPSADDVNFVLEPSGINAIAAEFEREYDFLESATLAQLDPSSSILDLLADEPEGETEKMLRTNKLRYEARRDLLVSKELFFDIVRLLGIEFQAS